VVQELAEVEEVLLGGRALGELGPAPLVLELGGVHGVVREVAEFYPLVGRGDAKPPVRPLHSGSRRGASLRSRRQEGRSAVPSSTEAARKIVELILSLLAQGETPEVILDGPSPLWGTLQSTRKGDPA